MCTAIAKRGNDLIYGFNLDVDPAVWNFSLYKSRNLFALGVTVGKTVYYVHGVNRLGQFGNSPYMNGEEMSVPHGMRRERIDLMNDRYIRGKYSFADIENIVGTKALTAVPGVTMHSLIGDGAGNMLIVEPGYGVKRVTDGYAAVTNFPVLAELTDYSNPFYGKERYDRAMTALRRSGNGFTAGDALKVLKDASQTGQWGTRFSFVYSRNENTVYYFLNGDDSEVFEHRFSRNE